VKLGYLGIARVDLGLVDKVALVTAASRGLGYAIAEELIAEGAKVVLSARDLQTLKAAAQALKTQERGDVVAIAADCTQGEDVKRLVREAENHFGRIDILVNNSGGPPTGAFTALSDDEWRQALEIKFLPQVLCAREVFPSMAKQGWGRIISIVGTHGRQPHAYAITAGVVNAALLNLTKALAEEGAPANVLVNAVNPGPIETDRMRYLVQKKAKELVLSDDRAKQLLTEEVLLKRFGQPREVAAVVVFLASERASFITGSMVNVDGGQIRAI
jgi:3-oxoacyl-[acyl-carrier protein] reductase